MIQNTSKEAYQSICKELGERQKEVLRALIMLKSANNREISQYLNLPINSITPRVKELRDLKRVGVDKEEIDTITLRKTIKWKLI